MTRQLRNNLIRIIALILVMLPALHPLLRTDFTCGYDNTFHLWRAVQVNEMWSRGVFFSRWAPDMAQGYGFPLFVFTSPGPSMVAALLHLTGFVWPLALNATFVLGIVLGGLFMLLLGDDLFGQKAGFVAAVAYVYAPFQAYDVFNRGSLWESFAWAFPPLVLWGIQRWAVQKQRIGLLAGVLGLALMVLSHHLFAFLFAPLLALWVILSAYLHKDWRVLGRGILLGVLGMGLTAFFWVPPLLERQYVQTGRLLGTWVFDYRYNFLSLRHLFALPRFADAQLVNDWPEKALGAVPACIGVLSVIGWHQKTRQQRWHTSLLLALAGVFCALTLPISRIVWDTLPLLSYIQFPWRFLGPAAFCLALLAGAAASALHEILGKRSSALWIPMLLSGFIICVNLGWFYPAHCSAPGDISIRAMLAWEQVTDTLGTTAKGEYLPVWVKEFPVHPDLQAAYQESMTINRLDAASVPAGSVILDAAYGAVRDRMHIKLERAAQLRWLRFYYPGWQVRIDGQRATVKPESGSGLITFDVPAGEHRIEVFFGETPERLAADAVSIAAVIAFLIVFIRVQPQSRMPSDGTHQHLSYWLLFACFVLFFKFEVADGEGSLWRRSRLRADESISGVALPARVNFDNKAMFLGVDGLPHTIAADEEPEVTMYWRAMQPGDGDWQVGLSLIGAWGETYHNLELRPARWARTPPPLAEWPRLMYARMDFNLEIPPGTPPGQYDVVLKLFDRDTLLPASVLGADGNPLGPEFLLSRIILGTPRVPYSLTDLDVPENAQPETCGPLLLWSMETDRSQAAPGDVFAVRWVWEAAADPEMNLHMPLLLTDAAGQVVWSWDKPLTASWWPTNLWQKGDRWTGTLRLRLPANLDSGQYAVTAGQDVCDGTRSVPIHVTAPERIWVLPDNYTPADAVFDSVITLKGYLLEYSTVKAGEEIPLSLAWEALAQMDNAYRIFVHVVDGNQRILTQNDGEPAGWTRPTTGWAVGEVVIDDRPLSTPADAPPGIYQITAGVYLADGTRLTLPDGGDIWLITTVTIE